MAAVLFDTQYRKTKELRPVSRVGNLNPTVNKPRQAKTGTPLLQVKCGEAES